MLRSSSLEPRPRKLLHFIAYLSNALVTQSLIKLILWIQDLSSLKLSALNREPLVLVEKTLAKKANQKTSMRPPSILSYPLRMVILTPLSLIISPNCNIIAVLLNKKTRWAAARSQLNLPPNLRMPSPKPWCAATSWTTVLANSVTLVPTLITRVSS